MSYSFSNAFKACSTPFRLFSSNLRCFGSLVSLICTCNLSLAFCNALYSVKNSAIALARCLGVDFSSSNVSTNVAALFLRLSFAPLTYNDRGITMTH